MVSSGVRICQPFCVININYHYETTLMIVDVVSWLLHNNSLHGCGTQKKKSVR